MVRGCQRKIIYLKNTDSQAFDEAYFLINEERSRTMGEKELIREANRIVEESLGYKDKRKKQNRTGLIIYGVSTFLLGALVSSGLWILLT